MAVTELVAARQLIRLSVLRGFPADESAAQTELLRALREASANPNHCARIVEAWIKRSPFSPAPSEIYETAEGLPSADHFERPDRKCAACCGTGYEIVWQLVTNEKNPSTGSTYKSKQLIEDEAVAAELRRKVDRVNQIVYECARRCTQCAYGRQFADEGAAA